MSYEIRSTTELRATDEGKLVGYAARYNSPSHDLGGFREIILPGAFDRTLEENPDILALAEHDSTKVLGRTTAGTLRITPDEYGLKVEIDPPNTSVGRDLTELVRRGDIRGMSFRFRPYANGASMDLNQTPPLRTLRSVELKEVSVVVDPAYPETSISVRALEDARNENIRHTLRRLRLELAENE
jgi:HK97 family phage prohead protease